MKNPHIIHLVAFIFLISPFLSFSQNSTGAYWQQKVDYKIEVTLNDTLHELNGFITIDYKNNSPDTLHFIYFHLWPDGYKDLYHPLAKQLLKNGKTAFQYSKPWQRGYIDSINFKLNAEVCKWKYDSVDDDICKIILNEPLKPGASVRISTPFHVKIPENFSRMCHVGQSYQITQWYPKPAVYDRYGWHPFPYLDQGEYYSEFGSFDVSITLPKNYVVGATGDLQDTSEISWMNQKAEEGKNAAKLYNNGDMSFPASAKEMKTLHYRQTNIHDFGWFADKRYHVLKGEVELPYTKRKVTTWALFTNNQAKYWAKAPEYIHDAIQYYSLWVGEYPYNQITAVDGTISAGSGMEYPNVTVIGEEKSPFSLDDVITHEVGHNWFYGMLGTNERDHAWMDEGINSYYEYRYIRIKYPNEGIGEISEGIKKFLDIDQYKKKYEDDIAYQFMARENNDQPIELTSSKFTMLNYGIVVYGKTMLIFSYLEAYLGTETFDLIMKEYFETWKYKHPQPEDLRKLFESETGKNLSWFFDELMNTTKKIDYRIATVRKTQKDNAPDSLYVKVVNVTGLASPVNISMLKKDSIIYTTWVDGFMGSQIVALPARGADEIKIDPQLLMPEINRKNNIYWLNKAAHKSLPLKLQLLLAAENQDKAQILFVPYIAWNNYDKTQVGLAFYNPFIPARKFSYLLVPAFGTGSKQFIGNGRVNYNFFPEKIQRVTIGLKAKRFSYLLFPKDLTFNKIEPYLNFDFKKKSALSDYSQNLLLRTVLVWQQWVNTSDSTEFANNISSWQHYYVNEAHYRLERNSTLHPFDVNVVLRQGSQFILLWTEAHFKISYKQKNQGLFVRVFAGGFPLYSKQSSDISAPLPTLNLSNNTYENYTYWLQKDYMYDENFIDRNGHDPYLGRQIGTGGGGFYSITQVGATNKFLSAVNVSSSIYRFVPIRPFASIGLLVDDYNKPLLAAEFGLSAVLIKDVLEIHLPIVTTKNISDNQNLIGLDKWYQKFSFTLELKLPKTINLARQFLGD